MRTTTPRMAEPRQPRAATAEKRSRLLDATERIMLTAGYAAVTSRRVEAEAGLKLHYHFGTLDDLFVDVFRWRAERNVERLQAALTSPEPLRAWWQILSDPRGTALFVELTAATNHHTALQWLSSCTTLARCRSSCWDRSFPSTASIRRRSRPR